MIVIGICFLIMAGVLLSTKYHSTISHAVITLFFCFGFSLLIGGALQSLVEVLK